MFHSQFPPVGGSARTQPVPFGGPPRREGPGCSVVSVWLPAAWGRHPRPRLLAAWWVFDRRYRALFSVRTRPPYQCFGMPGVLAVAFGFSVRRAPPLFVFSFGVCRRVCRRVCRHLGAVGGPFVLARPSCPTLSVLWRAWCSGGTVAVFPSAPPRPISAFVRSGFGGLERPSRIPIAARNKFVRRSES